MTNEKRQDGCAEWCGLPYADARVPAEWTNKYGWPFGHGPDTPDEEPAYCTAACLERAREKPVKRERPTTPEGWAALLPTEELPDTGPKKLRPGQVYAHGYKSMGYMIGEVGPRTTGPKRWVNGMLVNHEGYSFKRLAGNYTDALTFVTDECFVSRKFVLLFDAPEAAESVKREPVAPWTRSSGGQNCTTGFNWTTRQWDDESHYRGSHAMYTRPAPDGGSGNVVVCEACAERAGVFGPVDEKLTDPKPGMVFEVPENGIRKIVESCSSGVVFWAPGGYQNATVDSVRARMRYVGMAIGFQAPMKPPICSGPLATHGTPVLRWTINSVHEPQPFCDACYLEMEREWAQSTSDDACWLADGVQPELSVEPPARVGTVPQSLGPMRGIWASRGMRR